MRFGNLASAYHLVQARHPHTEHTGHSKHPLPSAQEKTLHMDITDGQYQNQIDYILCSKDGEVLYSQQKQDWELTVTQIMNSLLPNSDLN